MTEIIYSDTRVPNAGNRKVLNPRFFLVPEEGVKTVYLQDGWDIVRNAYQRVGAKTLPLTSLPSAPSAQPDKKEK